MAMAKRRRLAAVVASLMVAAGILLIGPGDPLDQRVPLTYRDLMRTPGLLPMDEPRLVGHIARLLDGPSSEEYRLREPERRDYSQQGQQAYLAGIIGDRRGGTFLEAGAFDGEMHSNTLFLERFLGWTGLLVEAQNWNYAKLLLKHRKARSLNACISPTGYPQEFAFENEPGAVTSFVDTQFKREELDDTLRLKQCFPLYSVLLAANLTTLDFLSLDVEGIDHLVLGSVPWKRVDIKIVLVEYVTPGVVDENGEFDPMFEEPITDLMLKNNYTLVHRLETDLLFVKNGSEYDKRS